MIGLFDKEYKPKAPAVVVLMNNSAVVVCFYQRHERGVRLSYGDYLACASVAGDNTLQLRCFGNTYKGKNEDDFECTPYSFASLRISKNIFSVNLKSVCCILSNIGLIAGITVSSFAFKNTPNVPVNCNPYLAAVFLAL